MWPNQNPTPQEANPNNNNNNYQQPTQPFIWPEPPQRDPNPKFTRLGCAIWFTLCLTILIIIGLLIFIFWPKRTKSEIRIDTLLTSVRNVSELTTLKAYFETIADKEDASTIWGFRIPGTARKFAVIFSGEVTCNFDLSRMRLEPAGEGKVIMTLPHGKIGVNVNLEEKTDDGDKTNADKDNTKDKNVRVYHQEAGMFSSSLTLDDQNKVMSNAIYEVRRKATYEWKLISQAENNAELFYKGFFRNLNLDVEVIFTDDEKKLTMSSSSNNDSPVIGASVIHTK